MVRNFSGIAVIRKATSGTATYMESIARALDVENYDLFEFAHLQAGGIKGEEVEKMLEGANEEKKRTIMKIIRAVVR